MLGLMICITIQGLPGQQQQQQQQQHQQQQQQPRSERFNARKSALQVDQEAWEESRLLSSGAAVRSSIDLDSEAINNEKDMKMAKIWSKCGMKEDVENGMILDILMLKQEEIVQNQFVGRKLIKMNLKHILKI